MLGTCGCTLQQLQLGLESREERGLLGAKPPGSVDPHSLNLPPPRRGPKDPGLASLGSRRQAGAPLT